MFVQLGSLMRKKAYKFIRIGKNKFLKKKAD